MMPASWTQFSWHVHRVIQHAFSAEGADPDTVAHSLIRQLKHRPNTAHDAANLERFLRHERELVQLLHFTQVANVPSIQRYGLVARAHLELRAVRLAVNPVFSDESRSDKRVEMNCLSMSYPNYGMFYRKRKNIGGEWAVLKINPYLIVHRYCEFTPSNAGRADMVPRPGLEGAQLLFCNWRLREKLGLERPDPTDPQAEILEDSVIEWKWIMDVAVQTASARDKLAKAGIASSVELDLFRPRADYKYWQENRLPMPENDYAAVLAYEDAQELVAEA